MVDVLVFALILMFLFVIGWHVILAILGGTFLLGASVWGIAVATVFAFCVAILLLFILTGVGIFVLAAVITIWTVLAIVLFPILFPVLIPIFILFMFFSYMRRKEGKKQQ